MNPAVAVFMEGGIDIVELFLGQCLFDLTIFKVDRRRFGIQSHGHFHNLRIVTLGVDLEKVDSRERGLPEYIGERSALDLDGFDLFLLDPESQKVAAVERCDLSRNMAVFSTSLIGYGI